MNRDERPPNPYKSLPARHFWRTAVADLDRDEISALWQPKFTITEETAFATYGSCFAQHFGQALRKRGFNWFIAETAPPLLNAEELNTFGYNLFSSRTGNIYTTSLLRQWTSWANGTATPPDEVWHHEDRVYDPFRPAIEPDGFADTEELHRTRSATIDAFARSIRNTDVFVFTLGLTESWRNVVGDFEYPMCPGTAAGQFDPDAHQFINQDFVTVDANLRAALDMMREMNPGIRFLLTVSPVPLTATASSDHVLVATMHSKSVLRAVAGNLAKTDDDVDYFPSFEIINAPTFRGEFFMPNQRNVAKRGVNFVMGHFFSAVRPARTNARTPQQRSRSKARPQQNRDFCEEAMLEAFGPNV